MRLVTIKPEALGSTGANQSATEICRVCHVRFRRLGRRRTHIFHFTGPENGWVRVEDPGNSTVADHGNFDSVWAGGSDDVWISGRDGAIRHWNGAAWSVTKLSATSGLGAVWGNDTDLWVSQNSASEQHSTPIYSANVSDALLRFQRR